MRPKIWSIFHLGLGESQILGNCVIDQEILWFAHDSDLETYQHLSMLVAFRLNSSLEKKKFRAEGTTPIRKTKLWKRAIQCPTERQLSICELCIQAQLSLTSHQPIPSSLVQKKSFYWLYNYALYFLS